MTKSNIQWTEETWNPVAGCSRVSPGCQHCYAEVMAKRLAAMGQKKYQGTIDKNGRWSGVMNRADDKGFNAPLRNKKPTVYFVNSMSDLLHENITIETLTDIFEIMARTPQHTYQVLTKRADRLWLLDHQIAPGVAYRLNRQREPNFWPLPNVWLGVSVENQQYADERIPYLLQTPAAVRFLSCEPLLGPVDLWSAKYPWPNAGAGVGNAFAWGKGINWVIVGGESGHGARPMHPDWVRRIRDDCHAGYTAFFFKQWGEFVPANQFVDVPGNGEWGTIGINGHYMKFTSNYNELIYRMGKHAAGRLLDGRTWDEFPQPQQAGQLELL